MLLIETPRVNYAPEPYELALGLLFMAKIHTTAPLCLESAWRVLLPLFIMMRRIRVVLEVGAGHEWVVVVV